MGRLDDIIKRNRRAQAPSLLGLAIATVEDAVDPHADPDDRRRRKIAWAIVLAIVAVAAIALAIAVRSSGDARGGTVFNRHGHLVELSKLWRDRRLVIVFYPNHACDACRDKLDELDVHLREIDATVIGIAGEPAAQAESLHEQLALHFELYADPNFEITTAWGIPFLRANEPRPGVFVVERDGAITFTRIGAPFPKLAEIVAATTRA